MKINAAVLTAFLFFTALPIVLLVWWKRRSGAKLLCFFTGALCFIVFAMLLESLLHAYCLQGDNRVSRFLLGSPAAYVLYASLAAGLFEETGRLFAYRLLLRRQRESACAVAYGIGHGGIEVWLLVGINYALILLAQLGVSLGSGVTAQMLAAAEAIRFPVAGVAMLERVSAMMLHIGLSMIVFVAARQRGRLWLHPLAILLHALVDAPAALYQYQGTPPVAVVEIVAFLGGLAYLVLGKKLLDQYRASEAEAVNPA